MVAQSSASQSLLVDVREAARLLFISPRKLWSLTVGGEIPCVRIGRAVRYDRADGGRVNRCQVRVRCRAAARSHPEQASRRATGTDQSHPIDADKAQRQAQQLGGETVLFGANSCVSKIVEDAKIDSPDDSQVEAPSELVPRDASDSEERRRWESNPRWRICNPKKTIEQILNAR